MCILCIFVLFSLASQDDCAEGIIGTLTELFKQVGRLLAVKTIADGDLRAPEEYAKIADYLGLWAKQFEPVTCLLFQPDAFVSDGQEIVQLGDTSSLAGSEDISEEDKRVISDFYQNKALRISETFFCLSSFLSQELDSNGCKSRKAFRLLFALVCLLVPGPASLLDDWRLSFYSAFIECLFVLLFLSQVQSRACEAMMQDVKEPIEKTQKLFTICVTQLDAGTFDKSAIPKEELSLGKEEWEKVACKLRALNLHHLHMKLEFATVVSASVHCLAQARFSHAFSIQGCQICGRAKLPEKALSAGVSSPTP